MTREQIDECEQAAMDRAAAVAYAASEDVAPKLQHRVFDMLYDNLGTGIRLMREEIERKNG